MNSRLTRVLGAASVLAVVASGTCAPIEPASAATLTKPPKPQVERSIDGKNFVPSTKSATPGAPESARGYNIAAKMVKAGRGRVTLPTARDKWVKTPGLPISLGAPDTSMASDDGVDVTVEVLSQEQASKAGVTGLLFRVTRDAPEGATAESASEHPDETTKLPVNVDYSTFKDAFGGDWASRLSLVQVPDCALSSGPSCADQRTLATKNDRTSKSLTATASMSGQSMLVAAAAADSGDQGDFAATPFSASSEWSVGLQTGDFSWSYPIPTIPVPSGLVPDVSIDYSAQSIDGRTQASNNQTSWLGEGQSLESGFIERSYAACADSQATNKTGDQCWKSDNATLSFQGQGSQLVRISGTNEWRAKNDEGWRIRRLTDTSPGNGDDNGEFWELTDQDGTRYYFGKERRFSGDTQTTGGAWTVPVFGDDAGEPCHEATFASSSCQQAWRWNLDYVVDLHGNTMTYKYAVETNRYGLNGNTAQPVYVRGGYLREIDYGQIAGSEDTATGAARILFDVAERCIPDSGFDCTEDKLTTVTASRWPDVPFDQICDDQASCEDSQSPTFFSRKRLVGIRTQVRSGGTYSDVDGFALNQSFPVAGDGTGRSLFLDSISRTGYSGTGGNITTPSVTFHAVQLPNRILTGGAAPLIKWRVDSIKTETGSIIGVNYSSADCTPTDLPASPSSNTRRCFPVYWQPNPYASPSLNWFNKYVVTSVVESDTNGTVTPIRTYYNYTGGAAWHYDDNELTKAKYRTWGQYRGYETVDVRKGDPGEVGTVQSYDKYVFMRGMDGDRLPDGSDADTDPDQRDVWVPDGDGGTLEDATRLAGFQREHIQRNGASGEIVSAVVNDPWRSPITADDGSDQARILRVGTIHTRKQLAGTSNYVRSTVTTDYDDYGLAQSVHDAGDDSKSTDSTCTRSWYARDVSKWLMSAVSETQTSNGNCALATPAAVDVLSDKRYSFDNGNFGTTPVKGDVTKEETLSGVVGNSSWKVTSQLAYDARGRVISTTDGLGNQSGVTYTPSGTDSTQIGAVAKQVSRNAKGQETITTFETARGNPLTITDPNNKVTSASYDALGRVTAVWRPGHVQGVDNADTKYSYTLSNTTYSYLVTSRLLNDGTYAASFDIYDALLRTAETQAPSAAADTDRVVTTTKFDSRGQKVLSLGPYLNAGATPSGTYFSPSSVQVSNNHRFIFDGAGRQTADVYQPLGTESPNGWRTTTIYDANKTSADPPVGGTPTTDVFDVRGNTVSHTDHLGTSPAASGQITTYGFDNAGRMVSMNDPKTNAWTWTYDLRGNQISSRDPDKGISSMTYDNNDQLVSSKDARNVSTFTKHDALGRRIGLYDGALEDATKLRAAWTYDTLAAGQLTSSTRYATPGNSTTAYVSQVSGYNDRYQPTGNSITIPSIAGQTDALAGIYTTTMTYNSDGTLKTKVLPSATGLPSETATYFYDRLGQLRTIGGRDSYVGASTYSPFGELLQLSMGTTSGKLAFQTWYLDEGTRRLNRNVVSNQAITGSVLDATYSYDQAGNITRMADAGQTADIQCFTYDYQRQLKEAWTINSGNCAAPTQTVMGTNAGAYWTSYTYDTIGNRLTRTDHVKTGSNNSVYTYTPGTSGPSVVPNGGTGAGGPHSVASVSKRVGTGTATTTPYKYDATGNMTLRGTESDTWDSEGELTSTKTGTAAAATNIYDADGNRILRRDPSGATTLYLDSTEIKLTGATKTSQRWYTFASKVVATRTSAGVFVTSSNDQNTGLVQMTATTAAYVKRRFDPFGAARVGSASTGATWNGDHGFLDKSVDVSGLTQVGARYYDSRLGRFISVDPVLDTKDTLQTNAYAYAANNPISTSDPTGERPACLDGGGCSFTPSPYGSGSGTTSAPPPRPKPPVVSKPGPAGAAGPPSKPPPPPAVQQVLNTLLAATASTPAQLASKPKEYLLDPFARALSTGPGRHAATSVNPWFPMLGNRTSNAQRLRSGREALIAGSDPLWRNSSKWDKVGKFVENPWVKKAGWVGAAIGTVGSYTENRADGDGRTEAALKTTIQGSFTAGGASLGVAAGGLCVVGAPACSAVLGGLGAVAGDALGGFVTDTLDTQIGWTANRLNDVGGGISSGVSNSVGFVKGIFG